MAQVVNSVIVPVYGNRDTLGALVSRLSTLFGQLEAPSEAVFVIDGSPDDSRDVLVRVLAESDIYWTIVDHSRNFGSFAAIRTGLQEARGQFFAVVAADLQEPPELLEDFFKALSSDVADIAVGKRVSRDDSKLSTASSNIFWSLYKSLVSPEIPKGGVDVFACNDVVRQELLKLNESNSSLIGQLYWVGFRRIEVPYSRAARTAGKSGWSFKKKIKYLLDSIFSFTDLPLVVLTWTGVIGGALTILAAIVVFTAYVRGMISEAGYTPLMLVVLFSTFAILSGLGIVGTYVWRVFENTKSRPLTIVSKRSSSTD